MKTKNLLIGILTIAVAVLGVLLYNAQIQIKEHNQTSLKDMVFCKDTLISTDGEKTTWNTVKPFIDAFDPNEEVRAFHIGMDNMRDLIAKIDSYNSSAASGNKIIGLRFYRTITTRKFISTGNILRTVADKPDLVVVPTLAEKNLHEVNLSANVPIYWHFRPCPRLCKKK